MKTIAVIGASGMQGGAVVKAFHELKSSGNAEFIIRGLSRDPSSEKAEAIKPFTDEFMKADADDVESMVKAFDGCYGAFVVTDFYQRFSAKHEMETTRNIKEAAKKAGLKHVVLSTLEDTRIIINNADNKDTWKVIDDELGMYVPHFDGKGEAADDFASEVPTTKLLTCMYMESFIHFGMGPSRQKDDDPFAITFPMGNSKLALVSLSDIGKMVCACFQDPATIGTTQGAMSDALTCKDIANLFAKYCNFPDVTYNDVPTEVYASFGFPGAAELANMFRYYKEFEDQFISSREANETALEKMGGTEKFSDWLQKNKDAFSA
mmetsp:Transcript_5660/g.7494  ORF Transcript_5660/g.7494 Transcript_5660/m.7494 type:complete len:321 (+) Transcript_5660:34-996(+)